MTIFSPSSSPTISNFPVNMSFLNTRSYNNYCVINNSILTTIKDNSFRIGFKHFLTSFELNYHRLSFNSFQHFSSIISELYNTSSLVNYFRFIIFTSKILSFGSTFIRIILFCHDSVLFSKR
mmetsp:Transcript_11077/g.1720  ORF Transcript_11077/g.1720 Transcript_11077/m.1720 type:complete len:122 (-) Transcript_11077:682-1047(-)